MSTKNRSIPAKQLQNLLSLKNLKSDFEKLKTSKNEVKLSELQKHFLNEPNFKELDLGNFKVENSESSSNILGNLPIVDEGKSGSLKEIGAIRKANFKQLSTFTESKEKPKSQNRASRAAGIEFQDIVKTVNSLNF